jgi:hypothetical protein
MLKTFSVSALVGSAMDEIMGELRNGCRGRATAFEFTWSGKCVSPFQSPTWPEIILLLSSLCNHCSVCVHEYYL